LPDNSVGERIALSVPYKKCLSLIGNAAAGDLFYWLFLISLRAVQALFDSRKNAGVNLFRILFYKAFSGIKRVKRSPSFTD
jgi:hypothetical protein